MSSSTTIANRSVLVTGANRGIGQALVAEALIRGAKRVYVGTRQPLTHPDERVTPLTLDVTIATQIQDAVESVESLDILINNAGIALYDDDLSDRPVPTRRSDSVNGVLPHLHAHDTTVLFVSRAPLDKLHAYKRRMGWSVPWVSDGDSGFTSAYGFSSTEEQTREWLPPMLESGRMPPIVEHNARATGTDPVSYLSEGFGFTAFVLDDDVVYHTYSTTARGVEFLMGYYAILDRAPKGRDEGESFQTWIRRHDEYDGE